MKRSRNMPAGQSSPTKSRRRSLGLESLERRTVMAAACVLTCEVVGNQLTVLGSSADDTIEIRFDSASRSLQVLGAGHVYGDFSIDDIHELRVFSLDGNDQFAVDANLPVTLWMDGGEGEDQLTLDTFPLTLHQHPPGASKGGVFERNIELVSRIQVASVGSANNTDSPANKLDAVAAGISAALLLTTHADHGSNSLATSTVGSEPAHHATNVNTSSAIARLSSSSHDDHANGWQNAAVIRDGSDGAHEGAETSGRVSLVGAAHHGGGSTKLAGAELAKKWCTTTPLANRLVTTLEGKPTCSCEEPRAAQNRGVSSGGPAGAVDDNGAGENIACQPSGRESAWDSLLADIESGRICSDKSTEELIAGIAANVTPPRIRLSSPGTNEESPWQERVTWIGWGLIAAGLYVTPLLLKKNETEADREAERQAELARFQQQLLSFA